MNILYIATSFPKPEKGATIYTDLAEELYEAGHNITVAVSEQTNSKEELGITKERGLDVLRINTGSYYDVSLIKKGITTLSIPFLMRRGISKHLRNKNFDFILYEAPPVTNADLITWAKQKFNCPSYLMLKDIFPQNAIDIGIMKKTNPIYSFFLNKERKLYKSASIIGCMSEANKKYILKHNSWLNSTKVEIFPNTKKITNNYKTDSHDMRKKLNIPLNTHVFLFGGNMGKPQYIELLRETIIKFKNNDNIYFLFVGRGTERHKLAEAISEYSIKNAQVIENLPRIEYDQIIKEIDVGLIILDPRFTIPNFPSRILSYMEYGKPVLAATDKNTDIREFIEKDAKCGKWVWSEDKEAFFKAIDKMSKNNGFVNLGENGRKYIEQHLTVKKSVEILENHFK